MSPSATRPRPAARAGRTCWAGLYDYADSDSILPASFWAAQPDSLCLPVLAAAVVPIFNVPQLSSLQLTQTALALIFMGNVTHWNDSAIAASNPGLELPYAPISVVVRSDSSGTTHIFTAALSAFYAPFNCHCRLSRAGATGPCLLAPCFTASGNTGVANLVASTALRHRLQRAERGRVPADHIRCRAERSRRLRPRLAISRAVRAVRARSADARPEHLRHPARPVRQQHLAGGPGRAARLPDQRLLVPRRLHQHDAGQPDLRCPLRPGAVHAVHAVQQRRVTIAAQSEFNSLPALLQQALDMQAGHHLQPSLPRRQPRLHSPAASSSVVSGSGALAVQSFLSFFTAAYASVDSASTFEYSASSSEQALQLIADGGQQPDVASFAVVMDAQLSASDLQLVASSSIARAAAAARRAAACRPRVQPARPDSLNLSVAVHRLHLQRRHPAVGRRGHRRAQPQCQPAVPAHHPHRRLV